MLSPILSKISRKQSRILDDVNGALMVNHSDDYVVNNVMIDMQFNKCSASGYVTDGWPLYYSTLVLTPCLLGTK